MSDYKVVCKDTAELNSIVRYLYNKAIAEIKKNNITPLLVETYRSQQRQNYLYCQGRGVSEATAKGISLDFAKLNCRSGSKVTWTLNSKHKNRTAVDLIPQRKVNGKWTAIWNMKDADFKKIIKIMEKWGFESGSKWSTPDGPHFQININTSKAISPTNTTKELTLMIQKRVNKKLKAADPKYKEMAEDGKWGNGTSTNLKAWKVANGLPNTAALNLTGLKKLFS